MKAIRILLVLFLISCNNTGDIEIVNNDCIISPGDTCVIELYAPYTKNNMPAFYLFSGKDTFALPFDFEKKCAVYKAIHNQEKKHKYSGYVEYFTLDNIMKKSTFEIRYEVKKLE